MNDDIKRMVARAGQFVDFALSKISDSEAALVKHVADTIRIEGTDEDTARSIEALIRAKAIGDARDKLKEAQALLRTAAKIDGAMTALDIGNMSAIGINSGSEVSLGDIIDLLPGLPVSAYKTALAECQCEGCKKRRGE